MTFDPSRALLLPTAAYSTVVLLVLALTMEGLMICFLLSTLDKPSFDAEGQTRPNHLRHREVSRIQAKINQFSLSI